MVGGKYDSNTNLVDAMEPTALDGDEKTKPKLHKSSGMAKQSSIVGTRVQHCQSFLSWILQLFSLNVHRCLLSRYMFFPRSSQVWRVPRRGSSHLMKSESSAIFSPTL